MTYVMVDIEADGPIPGDYSMVCLGAVVVEPTLEPFEYVVIVGDSQDVDGQDVEIRITMPIDAFMEFAPIAALEAAAVPHKFPVGFIYLREETTDRIARVAFVDAEPIAGRYLAGDEAAIEDMNEALIWH